MELKNGNVSLRPIRMEDKETMAELGNNTKISDNLTDSFPNPYTLEEAEKFITMAIKDIPTRRFAIEENGIYVGNVGLHPGQDIYRFNAELGYFVGEPYWGRGIATKAIKLASEYAFKELNIHRIYAGVFAYNPASEKVLQKCGFTFEGVFKKGLYKNGAFHDEMRYALVKD